MRWLHIFNMWTEVSSKVWNSTNLTPMTPNTKCSFAILPTERGTWSKQWRQICTGVELFSFLWKTWRRLECKSSSETQQFCHFPTLLSWFRSPFESCAALRIIVAHFPVDGWLSLQHMLKGHCSIQKAIEGWELDKYKLILCAGEDTGKVLKIPIRVKCLDLSSLLLLFTAFCSLQHLNFHGRQPFKKKKNIQPAEIKRWSKLIYDCLCLSSVGSSC